MSLISKQIGQLTHTLQEVLAKKILVVDDNASIRTVFCKKLGELGFDYHSSGGGEEALEELRSQPDAYFLVLLDMMMPHMDGMDMLCKLREFNPLIPVIMQTAHGTTHLATKFLKSGGNDFIEKPIDFEVLNLRINEQARLYLHALELNNYRHHLEDLVADRTKDVIESKNRLEHTLRLKNDLLANISHDLRTPMHSIMSFSDFALTKYGKVPEDRIRDYLSEVKSGANRLNAMLNQLITMSGKSVGEMAESKQNVSLYFLMQKTANSMQALAKEKNIKIHLSRKSTLNDKCSVKLSRMDHCLSNIVSIAISYSANDSDIHFDFSNSKEDAACQIQVKVSGRISEDIINVLRPENGLQDIQECHDSIDELGMMVTRQILHSHGGELEIQRGHDEGDVITVKVPVIK